MWKWIKSFFVKQEPVKESQQQWSLDQMPSGDSMMREVMMRALNSGNIVIASRDESGKVMFHE